ncbi:translation initiation factor IF-2 [Streptomyces sp. e14]|uniref:MBL fold metallo-hydrolase n=1 Tax=Streptomyces sp. e14 TaxID=645465 RepID=UPI0001D062B8|nr:MBL fold metallo-hydrolase [Streptomyces sp. e14]EFF88503.1 translation initiation factor IF-2 [Streptomyces sp. e14]
MTHDVAVHPLVSPWGRFGLYSFYIDAPQPAIVDTGIATSPAEGMAPALKALGRRIEDVRWILLTHGHIDHVGGAYALWERTGRRARVVIHEADAPMLRSRRAHVEEYRAGRGPYLRDPEGEAKVARAADAVISGEMEPTLLVRGGETLSLGGDVTVSVHAIAGHTPGSVAYVLRRTARGLRRRRRTGARAAQRLPRLTRFRPAYRTGLEHLRDRVRPRRLYLGHPYRRADGTPYGVELDEAQAREAIDQSLAAEDRVAAAACRCLEAGLTETDSPYSPFAPAAEALGYTGDPTLEPSPFFTSMHAYRTRARTRHTGAAQT